jgi:hypothetical protein
MQLRLLVRAATVYKILFARMQWKHPQLTDLLKKGEE